MKSELIKEEWKPVKGYEDIYDASNFGRVRSLKFGKVKVLKQFKKKNDYLRIELNKDGKRKTFSVHRLVYEAFNGEIPEGMQVNHINEIKTDNSLWNLNLMTPKENSNWGTGIKRNVDKRSKAVLQLTYPEGKFIKEWPSATEASRHGFNQGAILACCKGKFKQHKGYKWIKKETYSVFIPEIV